MSVRTILSDVVKAFEKVFTVGEAIAVKEEPLIDGLFPGIAPIFNTIVTEAGVIEAASAAAGKQTGSGISKLSAVVANVTPSVVATAVANGMQAPTAAEISLAASFFVQGMQVFKPATPAKT